MPKKSLIAFYLNDDNSIKMSTPSTSYDRGSRGHRGNGGRDRNGRDDRGRNYSNYFQNIQY